ncbi:uveal autoantigen with coiled-coil domains and ankyrin repeats protein isoform X2 [Fundulus heteroclitus]|uniref:uveal autoantigen with coiled-coil domains and ankyrin repeats protein isoform X2 n=1 Tax=Fundulus heteroclitus TaxID=8078 RepID=UPI00165AB9C5|nr:uveal autoantigen with coiled-coil domains and ankyrin repeats protein isoform X2 [Fundulus heteroclitus]
MKSLKYRLRKHELSITNTDWNKNDDRLMKAVERDEVDKVAAVLSKKGINPTKLDGEGRSAFHLAATRGQLDCLSLMLTHNVDITANDGSGKNALHLASKYGKSLCVQKLLQHNCPVGNMDLQGRTALHDAVMGDCPSSVKLLCDHGASVNAADFDGRTPLILATQMCHPHICQLLLERGADLSARDKQKKTALISGCEFGCKDAVEVLLRSGADVKAVDKTGHDAYHYARLSNNQELIALIKNILDKATRAEKEAAKIEQWKRQLSVERSEAAESNRKDQIIHDLERQNEALQEGLSQFQQEQKVMMDKVNMLQQQLNQEKKAVEDSHKEKETLKALLSAKEKEEGGRSPETSGVRVQHRSFLGEYPGQSVIKGKENLLVKQAHSLDFDQMPQNPAVSRQVQRSQTATDRDFSEGEALRREVETIRRKLQSTEEEKARLQSALNQKNRECQELAQSRDTIQNRADQQVQELEDALQDVQARMLDSECKVKQLQAHVVVMKENLGGQVTEELRAQLLDVKAKYEGASAEVGRVRNRLKQSEKALEEYKSSESQLATETERLGQELVALSAERDELADALLKMEAHLKEAQTKQANTVPAEKFDNMKNLLSNAVDEKERQLAELREDYDRVLEEVAELHRRLDSPSSQGTSAEEHQRIVSALEEQNAALKRKLVDLTAKSQNLIEEVEESEEERDVLREQLDELSSRIENEFVPIKEHEEVQNNMVTALEELKDKLVEASGRYGKAEAQLQQLQAEKATLQESVSSMEGGSQRSQKELDTLRAHNADLMEKLELLKKSCEDGERERAELAAQQQALQQSVEEKFVPWERHEKVKMELSSAIEVVKAEKLKLETKEKERGEELKNVKEGKKRLEEQLDKVLSEMKRECVSVSEHRAVADQLNAAVREAEQRASRASAQHALAQEEVLKLTQELEAQRKELDTLQEAIQSKFIPLTAAEEKETTYSSQVKALEQKLVEVEEKYHKERSAWESMKQEKEKLKVETESVQQRLDTALVSSERHKQVEEEFKAKFEAVAEKVAGLEQRLREATLQKAELQEQNALCKNQIQSLQERLKSELTRIATYDAELTLLQDALRQAQDDCRRAREAQQEEAQRVAVLQKERQDQRREEASLLQQHRQAQEALEAELAGLRTSLHEEEESNAQRAEDIRALQSELLQATQALEDVRHKEDQMNELKKEKQLLEEEAAGLSSKLLSSAKECQEARQEARQAREGESRARADAEAVQEKGRGIEREIRELKERYDQSLSTIGDLQKRIQTSAQQTEAKDKKITELLTDVERLKQALNGLSHLAYTSNTPNKRQMQQVDALQAQIKSLQQQLADAERQHREVVSIYRTHLLSAAQGHMDEDVQAALLQIIRMRQEFVC